MLVKSVFKSRAFWIQSEKENFDDCNFIWTQWIKDKHIQALPKYDPSCSPYPKSPLANCQDAQESEVTPTETPLIRIYNKMHANQCLSDKKHLFFNVRDLYHGEGKDPFSVMPVTYVIDDGLNDREFDRFEEEFKRIESANKKDNYGPDVNG